MLVLPLVSYLAEVEQATEEVSGIAALGIDPLAILAQAGSFLVLFYVVKKFALEKIVATLEERRKTIDKGVRLGYEMAEEQTKLQEKIEDQLRETREKADVIIADAHKDAGEVIKAAEDAANRKVDSMLAEAHIKIEDDMKKAKQALQKDVLGMVADATEIIIGEKLNTEKDNRLIEKVLGGVRK